MMNITIGERCSGKTTKLIKRSAYEGVHILVATRNRAKDLDQNAKRMGLNIPFPVTVDEYLKGNRFAGSSIRRDGLLIDDADDVLQQIFAGISIKEVTVTDRGNISWLKPIRYEDRVKHGRWIEKYTDDGHFLCYDCSCCHVGALMRTDYCSSCGAEMNKDEEGVDIF